MNEIQPLIDLLKGSHGWLSTVFVWMGALRLAAKPFGAFVQNALTKLAANAPDLAEGLTVTTGYRITAWLIDLFCSVKLPTAAALKAVPKNE